MPLPMSRNGNVFIESASFTKCHGVTPSSCDVVTEAEILKRLGDVLVMNIGGSHWMGRWSDTRRRTAEGTGRTSKLQATDFRDDLYSVVVFAKINMLDRETGEVYSVIEGIDDPDTAYQGSGETIGLAGMVGQFRQRLRDDIQTFREKLRNDISYFRDSIYNAGGDPSNLSYSTLAPAVFRTYDPNGWILQAPRYGWINSQDIIQWLCALCGFRCVFSTEAQLRMDASATSNWFDSRFNVFNLDWNAGTKIGPALNEVLERIGLQVNLRMDWTRTLQFTLKGEGSYSSIVWNGQAAAESEDGWAIQNDVDTGVWIVGDRDLYEFVDLPLIPDWNQAWNTIYLDGGTLELMELLKDLGLNPSTARVSQLPAQYKDDQWQDGKPRNDMLASDYLTTFPFKCYRIQGMDKILSAEEFTGEVDVMDAPISTPLVDYPNKQYILKANIWDPDKVYLTPEAPSLIEMYDGHRLDERTGRVWFDEPRYLINTATFTSQDLDDLLPEDIIVDQPTIRVVFRGPMLRKFFGTTERVGTKTVSGLRKAFIVQDLQAEIANASEYVQDGERSADLTAADIAAAYLGRQRYVRSGSEQFIGVAGHEPSGEIQRVSVSLDPNSGIREQVSYANDEANPSYEPQIELNRKILSTELARFLVRRTDLVRDRMKDIAWKKAVNIKKHENTTMHDHLRDMAMRSGSAVVQDVQSAERGTSDGAFASGEPVAAAKDAVSGRFKTSTKADLTDGDTKIIGVALKKAGENSRWLHVATSGIAKALVLGPVVRGDLLAYDKTNKCLKKGSEGAKFTAEEAYATTTPDKKFVRIGVSAAEPTQRFKVVSVNNDTITCHTWDGTTEGTDEILVAKPPLMRYSVLHGKTRNGVTYSFSNGYTLTASKAGEDNITEYITPSYQPGDIIRARKCKNDVDGVDYEDVNNDGRAFMESDE